MPETPSPSGLRCLNATCTKECTTECCAVIQQAWQALRYPHRLTAAPYDPEVERKATERAEAAAAASERGARWFAAQRDTTGVKQLRVNLAQVEAIATRWEKYGSRDLRTAARILRTEVLGPSQQPSTAPVHLAKGSNAEDCPACENTNPPYPFLCPGSGR